ncbi:hypothetical protein [Dolichospermum circinale]|uniref:hypothetical protein n=1 Tax=Dolichospermum circinale TaxID=109265 RepID=UPI000413168C|nr:hypothetical protein [Dolichospermum circinale]MDB9473001.1 hypothetical protein [Dolichospermum circinale CS-537/11]MDB9478051.1 hypothetical protein [Dolichospermum circinale CS-537/03]
MKKQQIQNLFNQRYNQAKWKQFLGQTFANVQLLSTPENLTGIDDHVATNAQKLGYILLDENGIDRQIAVYDNSRGEIGLQKHLVTEGKYAVIGGKEINKYRQYGL